MHLFLLRGSCLETFCNLSHFCTPACFFLSFLCTCEDFSCGKLVADDQTDNRELRGGSVVLVSPIPRGRPKNTASQLRSLPIKSSGLGVFVFSSKHLVPGSCESFYTAFGNIVPFTHGLTHTYIQNQCWGKEPPMAE